MASKTKKLTVAVWYWVGTTRYQGEATSYRGALRLAARNRNAYGPTFYDPEGRQLYDDGHGLRYEDEDLYFFLR